MANVPTLCVTSMETKGEHDSQVLKNGAQCQYREWKGQVPTPASKLKFVLSLDGKSSNVLATPKPDLTGHPVGMLPRAGQHVVGEPSRVMRSFKRPKRLRLRKGMISMSGLSLLQLRVSTILNW